MTLFLKVNTYFNGVSLEEQNGNRLGVHVAKPKLQTPEFGAWLSRKRGRQGDVAIAAKLRDALGQKLKLNRSSLRKLEAGQLPSVLLAHAIAQVFKTPIADVVGAIVGELVADDKPRLSAEPLLSDEAMRLAQWFDAQDSTRRRSVLSALNVTDTEPTAAYAERQSPHEMDSIVSDAATDIRRSVAGEPRLVRRRTEELGKLTTKKSR